MIGTPTTGEVRMEWVMARYGQVIPTNWSQVQMNQFLNPFAPIGYQVADAQNLIVKAAVEQDFEWGFKPETLIQVERGAVEIKDIQVGDMVKTHIGEYRKVTKKLVGRFKQRNELRWITTIGHSLIKCTPNQPFFIRREKDEFIEAKNLREGDLLLFPFKERKDYLNFDLRFNIVGNGYHNLVGGKRNAKYLGNVEVNRRLARFMGLFLAEGHCDRDGIALTFGNDELEYQSFVSEIYQSIFGRKATICRNWSTQLRLSIKNLSPIFKKWFGVNARVKKVPDFVFSWNIINKLEFLWGYLEGDGSWRKAGDIAFGSASRELMEGVIKLGQNCGLKFSIVYTIKPTTNYYNGKAIINSGSFSTTICKRSVCKLLDLLYARPRKGYLEILVRGVESHNVSASLKDESIYNLEVESDNSYIANSVAVLAQTLSPISKSVKQEVPLPL